MAKPSAIIWLPMWESALDPAVEIGIAFKISGVDRDYFRNTLYECRKLAHDPRLEEIIIFSPGGDHTDELWMCKKQVELDAD
mgnify:FL=1